MKKVRGFEIAKGWEDKEINLPIRKTKNSAGYDIEAAEDTIVPAFKPGQKPTLVKTGLKVYCQDDEYIMLCNRSSNPGKKGLVMANSVGIVDSDYYGNETNDGHFYFQFWNFGENDLAVLNWLNEAFVNVSNKMNGKLRMPKHVIFTDNPKILGENTMAGVVLDQNLPKELKKYSGYFYVNKKCRKP